MAVKTNPDRPGTFKIVRQSKVRRAYVIFDPGGGTLSELWLDIP